MDHLMTAAQKFASTAYIVEATSCEYQSFWVEWHDRVSWEETMSGFSLQVGELAGYPVIIMVHWARINGRLVAFYEGCSLVVHHGMIKDWIKERCPNRLGHCNATNIHNGMRAIGGVP